MHLCIQIDKRDNRNLLSEHFIYNNNAYSTVLMFQARRCEGKLMQKTRQNTIFHLPFIGKNHKFEKNLILSFYFNFNQRCSCGVGENVFIEKRLLFISRVDFFASTFPFVLHTSYTEFHVLFLSTSPYPLV